MMAENMTQLCAKQLLEATSWLKAMPDVMMLVKLKMNNRARQARAALGSFGEGCSSSLFETACCS